jgi:hypothetical protein
MRGCAADTDVGVESAAYVGTEGEYRGDEGVPTGV